MSRSFRDLLKFSVPVLLSAALLSGCGSGSSGSADLGQGPSVESPPPPVTVTETFNFEAPYDFFVVGTPPIHARFSGGRPAATAPGSFRPARPPSSTSARRPTRSSSRPRTTTRRPQPLPRRLRRPRCRVRRSRRSMRRSIRRCTSAAACAVTGPYCPSTSCRRSRDNVLAVTIPLAAGRLPVQGRRRRLDRRHELRRLREPDAGPARRRLHARLQQRLAEPRDHDRDGRRLQVHLRRDRRRQDRADDHGRSGHRRRWWRRRAGGARGQHHHPHLRQGRADRRLAAHAAQDRQGRRPARRRRTAPGRRHAHHAHRDREHRHRRRRRRRGLRVDRESALRAEPASTSTSSTRVRRA